MIVLENDLRRQLAATRFEEFAAAARCIIAVDHLENATVQRAHCVLPAGTFAESSGTLVSNEGRAQRFYKVLDPTEPVQDSWRWLGELAAASGAAAQNPWPNLDAVIAAVAAEFPALKEIVEIAPPASFRLDGQQVARQPHRYSGRTAETANVSVFEPPPPEDNDSPLAFSMEGYAKEPPSPLIPRFWAPGWNSGPQAINKFQIEVGGPLHGGDPGKRLIAGGADQNMACFANAPQPFEPREGEFFVVPRHHIFGSEPLSSAGESMAVLLPRPYLAISSNDAAAAGIKGGQEITVSIGGQSYRLIVLIDESLPGGVAAAPEGVAGMEGLDLPSWAKISAQESGGPLGGGAS